MTPVECAPPNKRFKLPAPRFWEGVRLCAAGLRGSLK